MTERAHEQEVTGRGLHLFREALQPATKDKPYQSFFTDSTPVKYGRTREVDVLHIKLDIAFDIPAKKVIGKAHLTFTPIDAVPTLTLDACDMTLGSITLDGKAIESSYDGSKLTLRFPRPLPAGKDATVVIAYSVTKPRAGMYFIGPDKHYPDKPVEIWTQGQDEDSRYWFPCFDYPNEKSTTEIVVTVPKHFNTLSNGKLLSVKTQGKTKVFHWYHDVPHVSYLVTLVAGEFVEIKDEWDGIPVTYFSHPGDEKRAKNSFGDTPKMVKYFSEIIGVRYPYAKYSQIPVTDFIFGGMENTTATTQTAFTLHDDRAHLDFSSNPLVCHELGHQWFGNLLTCRDWSHGWLNEGFTTYMECCWTQEEKGDEEFQYYMYQEMQSYLSEDKNSYRRPIVCNRYHEPIDLFDRHLYEKGACVQHMLRFILGEKLFWKALKLYTQRHAGGCVVTEDWISAIQDATGRNVEEFFDQWIYGGGHPEFKLSLNYDEKQKTASLGVFQTQNKDDLTAVFKLPVRVAFTRLKGKQVAQREERTITIEQAEQTFHLPLKFQPDFVTFDVGNWILKTLDLSGMPEGGLISQLQHDTDCMARLHAAKELGKRATRLAVEALADAIRKEKQWFVQGAIAEALGKIGNDAARSTLLANLGTKHPKARRAVVAALGEFRREKDAADALLNVVKKGDASYFVETDACTALGKTRDERAKDALFWALDTKDSHNEVIRIGALDGLVGLEDVSALPRIKKICQPGVPIRLRYNALMKLGELGKLADENERRRLRVYFEEVLEDHDFWISIGSIAGIVALGDAEGASALRRKERIAVDGRIKARARRGADALASKAASPRQFKDLRDEVEDLKKTNRKLTERMDEMAAKKR